MLIGQKESSKYCLGASLPIWWIDSTYYHYNLCRHFVEIDKLIVKFIRKFKEPVITKTALDTGRTKVSESNISFKAIVLR
jgi:hypothetical protein